MSIIRTEKDKNHPYVLLNKSFFEDQNLSLRAKGLLGYCLTKPDGWQFHVSQLVSVLKEGKEAIYSTIKELVENGYCEKVQSKDDKGQFKTFDYVIHESKLKKKVPLPAFPEAGTPDPVNPQLVINDCIENNDKSNIPPIFPQRGKKKSEKIDQNQKPERALDVRTSDEEHAKLVKAYGEDKTKQAYYFLSQWKESKREVDPDALKKHTDYGRITRWVMKELIKSGLPSKTNTKTQKHTEYESKQHSPEDLKKIKEESEKQINIFYKQFLMPLNDMKDIKGLGRKFVVDMDKLMYYDENQNVITIRYEEKNAKRDIENLLKSLNIKLKHIGLK